MARIASLGMYDPPWLHAANDRLWRDLRERLAIADAPAALTRAMSLETIWHHPDLLLAQTCGLPLLQDLVSRVQVVATPCYDFPGCDGAWHGSALVVRADDPAVALADLRGRRAAINGWDSNTGMNLLRAAVAPLSRDGRFFSTLHLSGGHLASLEAVRAGDADIAAIDAVTHGLAARHRPDLLAGTRVLCRTAATPGLPLITAAATPAGEVLALRQALRALPPQPDLGWLGVCVLDVEAYAPVLALAREAASRGYPALA